MKMILILMVFLGIMSSRNVEALVMTSEITTNANSRESYTFLEEELRVKQVLQLQKETIKKSPSKEYPWFEHFWVNRKILISEWWECFPIRFSWLYQNWFQGLIISMALLTFLVCIFTWRIFVPTSDST